MIDPRNREASFQCAFKKKRGSRSRRSEAGPAPNQKSPPKPGRNQVGTHWAPRKSRYVSGWSLMHRRRFPLKRKRLGGDLYVAVRDRLGARMIPRGKARSTRRADARPAAPAQRLEAPGRATTERSGTVPTPPSGYSFRATASAATRKLAPTPSTASTIFWIALPSAFASSVRSSARNTRCTDTERWPGSSGAPR